MIEVREAELELFAACQRMQLGEDASLFILLREYAVMRRQLIPGWEPPVRIMGISDG